jgi:predicted lipase
LAAVPSGGNVQDYFYQGYAGLQSELSAALGNAVIANPSYTVLITGHSLGGSLASIAAADLSHNGVVKGAIQYTFGEPRTGDSDFASGHDNLLAASYRVVHYR